MKEVEFIESLGVLNVQSGDTVVVRLKDPLMKGQYDQLTAVLAKHFPNNKILLLDNGTDIGVVRFNTPRPYPLE